MHVIVPESYERRGGTVTKWLGRTLMRLSGWSFEGTLPDIPKVVISVAPHTSNWDFVVGVMALWALDLRISFIGKHTLFKGWFGRWMTSIGGIPVDRSAAHGVVGEMVNAFHRSPRMVFALAPEGTRQLDKGFKSGFLHIARCAHVPVLLAYFDFSRKVVGFGPLFQTSEDPKRDLAEILVFYRSVQGRYQKDWQKELRTQS